MLIFLRIHCVALNRLSLLMGDSPISLGVSMKSEVFLFSFSVTMQGGLLSVGQVDAKHDVM